jgi:hypothetical protein
MPCYLLFVLLAVSYLCSNFSTAHAASYTFTTWKVSDFRSRDAHDFYAGITISNTS